MEYLKTAVVRGVIPFFIMTGIALIMKNQNLDPSQVRSTFLTGLIVSFISATSVIYEIGSWSILKQSIVHFIVMLFTVLPILIMSGWFVLKSSLDYVKLVGIFIFVGFVLWLFFYILFTKIIKG